MTAKQNSSLGIVFILGLLAMLMPLSICISGGAGDFGAV